MLLVGLKAPESTAQGFSLGFLANERSGPERSGEPIGPPGVPVSGEAETTPRTLIDPGRCLLATFQAAPVHLRFPKAEALGCGLATFQAAGQFAPFSGSASCTDRRIGDC